ncbi:hypothetical protein EMCRGX_G028354 [Ephydatia muelleri]
MSTATSSLYGRLSLTLVRANTVCVEDALTSPILQKVLSNKVDIYQFNMAMKNSSLADKAHQPSVSSSHAASWIYVILSEGAHLSAKVEGGSNLTHDHTHSRPANILVRNWSVDKPAAFDLSVTSPLNSSETLSRYGNQSYGAEDMRPMTPSARSWGGSVSPW